MKTQGKAYELYIALRKMIRKEIVAVTIPMTVVSVDKAKATCTCKEEDSDVYPNVRLKSVADDSNIGAIIYPAVNSEVLVSKIMNDENNLFIVKINTVESILITVKDVFKCELKPDGKLIFNSGENKGLVKLLQAVENFDKIKNYADAIETAAGGIASALEGLVPGTSLTYSGITEPAKAACVFVDMENTKIEH
jgi:hypothetical protein